MGLRSKSPIPTGGGPWERNSRQVREREKVVGVGARCWICDIPDVLFADGLPRFMVALAKPSPEHLKGLEEGPPSLVKLRGARDVCCLFFSNFHSSFSTRVQPHARKPELRSPLKKKRRMPTGKGQICSWVWGMHSLSGRYKGLEST